MHFCRLSELTNRKNGAQQAQVTAGFLAKPPTIANSPLFSPLYLRFQPFTRNALFESQCGDSFAQITLVASICQSCVKQLAIYFAVFLTFNLQAFE